MSMGFSRKEYWSGLPFPSPGDLPHLGSNPPLLHLLHCRQILYLLGERATLVNKTPVPVPQLSQFVHIKMHKKTPGSWMFPHLQNYSALRFTYHSPDIISVTFKIADVISTDGSLFNTGGFSPQTSSCFLQCLCPGYHLWVVSFRLHSFSRKQ